MARTLIALTLVVVLGAGCKRQEDARPAAAPAADAGAATPASTTATPSAAAASSSELTFQLFGDPAEVDAYRALVAAFERKHPEVKVRLLPVGGQKDHMAKLATAFSGGTPPDVFLVNYRRTGQLAERGVLEPLGDHLAEAGLAESGFYPETLDAFRWNGKLLCLPQNVSSLVVYFNRALFEARHVPLPEAGWTWEQFRDAAKRLTDTSSKDARAHVYGAGIEPSIARFAPFVWQAGGEVVDDTARPTRLTLNTTPAVQALKLLLSMRRLDGSTPPLEAVKAEDLEARFAHGRLGMILHSRRFTATLRTFESLDWDVAPLPAGKTAATLLHSDAYCVPRASAAKPAAITFVGFALGDEGARLISASGRTVPSRRSVAESEAFLDPRQRPASARVFLDVIPTLRRLPSTATWHEIETRADTIAEEWYYGPDITPWGLKGPPGGPGRFPGSAKGAARTPDELTVLQKEIDEATKGLWATTP